MSILTLTILIIISVSIHIWGEYNGPDLLIYVFKPLTTLLIITTAVLEKKSIIKSYKALVIIGLIFSLGGDILLMLPYDLFVFGLISFLIAQLIYIYAFSRENPWQLSWLPIFTAIVYGVGIYFILAPGLGDLRFPVAIYLLVIQTMGYTAWNQWNQTRSHWALMAFIGALIFIFSDSILAVNKFSQPFAAARGLTLTTYFTAQWLIARSIGRKL